MIKLALIILAAATSSCVTAAHPPYRYNIGDCVREDGSDIEQFIVAINSSTFEITTKFSDSNGLAFYNQFNLEQQMELGVCK